MLKWLNIVTMPLANNSRAIISGQKCIGFSGYPRTYVGTHFIHAYVVGVECACLRVFELVSPGS